jgi:hypothetical protein
MCNEFGLTHYIYPRAKHVVHANMNPHSPLSPVWSIKVILYSTFKESKVEIIPLIPLVKLKIILSGGFHVYKITQQ